MLPRYGVVLLTLSVLSVFGCAATGPAAPACQGELDVRGGREAPVSVILDTDFAPDVDDVGALAVLHALADLGEAEILGVLVNSGNTYAPRAVDTVNTYYGRPDIPIGMSHAPTAATDSPYTLELALDYPNDLVPTFSAVVPSAVEIYRQLLAEQSDGSVTIVSVGFLTSLRDLLNSEPDRFSELTGVELVAAKVVRLVVMGGDYPDSSGLSGGEYNFVMDARATVDAVSRWPTPILFSGFHPGVDIETGAVLQDHTPPDNPVRAAYQLYTGGANRNSWDLTAVHLAVRGTGQIWRLCGPGLNHVTPAGANRWTADAEGQHYYVMPATSIDEIERLLDDLLVRSPTLRFMQN